MNGIVIHDLTKSFDGQIIFEHFNTTIPYGKTTFIQGRSAIGKTTLCRILSGLEDYGGTIEGLDNLKISMIFQADHLVESLSILNNLRLVRPEDDPGFDDRLMDGLKAFGLYEDRYKSINQCSGGMKRRVSILRALLIDFDVLIADEALKGMDPTTESMVMSYLLKVCHGKTIIWVSHHDNERHYFNDQTTLTIG